MVEAINNYHFFFHYTHSKIYSRDFELQEIQCFIQYVLLDVEIDKRILLAMFSIFSIIRYISDRIP